MSTQQARLTVLLDEEKKREFDAHCAARGVTASEVVRELVQRFIQEPGMFEDDWKLSD